MAEVYILLGGNVGDKSIIFEQTRKLIEKRIGHVKKHSAVYLTEPWGFESDMFWNQVIIAETALTPLQILKLTQLIEIEMGRIKQSAQYEARVMDIDLLFYNNIQLDTARLTIPHPKMGERKFVLVPLNELAPDKVHPVTGLTVREMLLRCTDQLMVNRID